MGRLPFCGGARDPAQPRRAANMERASPPAWWHRRGIPSSEEPTVSEVHLEIERKFDVDPGFALPGLTDVDGVARVEAPEERRLEAVYHDSADLRLARAAVTMRRRTGGPDAGWHVKLPEAAGARRELHSPLGRAGRTPPKAVQAPVLGIVRSAPVGPV